MVLVRETVAADWQALRDIRLEALRNAPEAFGSTYEREIDRPEAHWRERIARGGTFLAFLDENSALPEVNALTKDSAPAGLAGGYLEDPDTAELVSMYVRPQARGHAVGEALVAAVARWAEAKHAKSLHLWVTETNAPARQLYERCGFSPTAERQPLPSNPSLGEIAMTLPL
jgi:GNAT superfamily N-acetyltransferase